MKKSKSNKKVQDCSANSNCGGGRCKSTKTKDCK